MSSVKAKYLFGGKCSKCERDLPAQAYSKGHGTCKECRVVIEVNRVRGSEKRKEYLKQWYKNNPEKQKIYYENAKAKGRASYTL